ncbi:YesL family protein [Extibacter muris]|uniref:YesL family protein n=1 Tax=Extibacter muris TaxID=1796622 RepID=UPI003B506935
MPALENHIIIRILTRIFDLIVLNILWLVCSVPIVTIGASTTALYSVMLKVVAGEEGYIMKDFLKAFRVSFRQSTAVWLILLAAGTALGADIVIFQRASGAARAGLAVFYIIAFFYAIEVIFVFPLIAKFENTTGNMLKNAILIPASRLPFAAAVLVMTGTCLVLTFLNYTTLMVGAAVWGIIGVAVLAYVNSIFIRKIIEPYI